MIINILCIILAAAVLFMFVKKTLFSVHMLQQSAYRSGDYLKWCDDNLTRNISAPEISAMAVSVALFFMGSKFAEDYTAGVLNTAATLAIVLVGLFPIKKYSVKKAKKPLVYTARVKRLLVTAGILAIGVFACGIVASLTFKTVYPALYSLVLLTVFNFIFVAVANVVVRPVELMVNRHYYNDAKKILRAMPELKIIGITGSYGKTSSKYILSQILSAKYNTLMTPESYNTPMGVIKTVRGSLKPTHEIFVCEMGAKYRKDIQELCNLVKPGYGLLTSIGPQHLESFKTLRNVIDTKMDLVGSLRDKSNAVLNMENKYISEEAPAESVGYSVDYVKGTDYWAEDISYGPEGVKFTLCTTKGERVVFESKLLGRHNILNIVGAVAMAQLMGMSIEEAVYPVKRLESVPHRLELKLKPNGVTVIDDAFNSNIEGAKSAVEVLGSFPEGGRILITPGIVEAGDKEYDLNFEFAKKAGEHCDFIILVGEKQTKPIREGLKEMNYDEEKLFVARDLNEAIAKMNEIAKSGSTVLFENDLPDLYNEKLI